MRQSRRERGQQEAVQAHGQQHAPVEQGVGPARLHPGPDQHGQPHGEPGAGQIEQDQDLPPRPAVQHHPDERSQDREGQQGDGQHGGDRGRIGLALR